MSFVRTNREGLIPTSQIGYGTATSDKYLRADRVWSVPPAGEGGSSGNIDGGHPDSVYGGAVVIDCGGP